MHNAAKRLRVGLAAAVSLLGWLVLSPAWAEEPDQAKEILAATGVKGGLIVHLGCGDGKLTAALRASDSYIVHGLDHDAANVEQARAHIRSLGLYGKVSVDRLAGGPLPYADNLVNLVVAGGNCRMSSEEMMRVLAPLGVAYVEQAGKWTKTVKPWPKEMDEWTHWLHDAGSNAVAHDTLVGPPRRMHWVAEPLWSRGHEVPSSVGGLVTARGRLFYALDEGQCGIYTLPSKWTLVARDAFNGALLWKRPVPHWGPALSFGGFGNGFRPRRLVTDGERVFLPTGNDAVLAALDAATGEAVKTLAEARGTTDILCGDGLLVAACSPGAPVDAKGKGRSAAALIAARPDTLEVLWKAPAAGVAPQTLALGAGRVAFKAGNDIVALDAKTGREAWRAPFVEPAPKDPRRRGGTSVMIAGGTVYVQGGGKLAALAADTGKTLWEEQGRTSSKGELFAAGGLVWQTAGANIAGRDPASGQVRKTINASSVFSSGHHPRCYPNKATERYAITNNRGAEFISLASDERVANDWLRGNCGHGVTPANGLLYAPPCQCFCYGGVMLTGFKALATGPAAWPATTPGPDRIERGPAYEAVGGRQKAVGSEGDWPMYRRGPARLGSTTAAVAAEVKPLWQAKLGGLLTPPVAAGGLVLVAARDAHTVHALDAATGAPRWAFTAGGRIDSPPTVHEGLVLFGCADGWAYCLRAADGVLAWRFRAAPEERLIGAFGQLESAWPVHGSVLVANGVAYLTAGRSTWLDGGIHAYGLDPRTGRVVHYARLEGAATAPGEEQPGGERQFVPAFHVEGARTDLLVSDGQALYLGPLKLDLALKRLPTPYVDPGATKTTGIELAEAPYVDTGIFKAGFEKKRGTDFPSLGVLRGPMGDKAMGLRVCATGGFLDDSGFNRAFWMYSALWPGYYIAHLSPKAGQLLAVDATTTYAVQCFPSRTIHSATFTPGKKGYLLCADANQNEPALDHRARGRDKGMGYTRLAAPKWFQWVPVRVRGMVAAGGTLFVAGPPDDAPDDDPYVAFEGRKGAVLWALATADGKKLAERKLDAPPVFDGLIAAGDRLTLCTTDGKVLSLGKGDVK